MTTKGIPRKLSKLAPFDAEEQAMIDRIPTEREAINAIVLHRQFMAMPAEERLEAGYLTGQERRLVAASRLFDEWYAGLSLAQRRQLWAMSQTDRLEAIKTIPTIQQISALIEQH